MMRREDIKKCISDCRGQSELHISGNFDNLSIQILGEELGQLPADSTFQTINITESDNESLSSVSINPIFLGLRKFAKPINLTIQGMKFAEQKHSRAKALIDALRENQLISLEFYNCEISSEIMADIGDGLQNNTSLLELKLINSTFSDVALRDLSAGIKTSHLLSINLDNSEGVESGREKDDAALSEGLSNIFQNSHLKELILNMHYGFEGLGPKSVLALSEGIKNHHSIKVLGLEELLSRKEDMLVLCDGIKSNQTIETLSFKSCLVDGEVMKKLVEALLNAESTTPIRELAFLCCDMDTGGLANLAKLIEANKTLTTIDLENSITTNEGAQFLIDSLLHNNTLRVISINQNEEYLSDEMMQKLRATVQRHTEIVKILNDTSLSQFHTTATTNSKVTLPFNVEDTEDEEVGENRYKKRKPEDQPSTLKKHKGEGESTLPADSIHSAQTKAMQKSSHVSASTSIGEKTSQVGGPPFFRPVSPQFVQSITTPVQILFYKFYAALGFQALAPDDINHKGLKEIIADLDRVMQALGLDSLDDKTMIRNILRFRINGDQLISDHQVFIDNLHHFINYLSTLTIQRLIAANLASPYTVFNPQHELGVHDVTEDVLHTAFTTPEELKKLYVLTAPNEQAGEFNSTPAQTIIIQNTLDYVDGCRRKIIDVKERESILQAEVKKADIMKQLTPNSEQEESIAKKQQSSPRAKK